MGLQAGLVVAVALLAVVGSAPVSNNLADVDIDKTLQNVQDILDANPTLPRLSKDEILMLLNNITAEDNKLKNEAAAAVQPHKSDENRDEKIMVVLPYHPREEDVTELFTKAPIVKYVSSNANREELTTVATAKKQNKPKKATNTYKTDEAKDLTRDEQSFLSSLNSQKNKFSVIEDAAYFNHELIDQNPAESGSIASPDLSAYETFKPIPEGSRFDESIPIDVRNILKAIENEEKAKEDDNKGEESQQAPQPTFEIINMESFPEEMSSLMAELGMTDTKTNQQAPKSPSRGGKKFNSENQSEGLSNGPDPLSIDEALSVDDSIGNDIKKRQQSTETTTDKKEEDAKTESTTSTTTEGPNVADLESSFGGSSADNDPSEAELPPPRKNGFYYMLDWNSFLEVGDGDTKVNIRFDPKLGDPQRFIAVNVP